MPGMPPPIGIAGAAASLAGLSATMDSVVRIIAAMLAALLQCASGNFGRVNDTGFNHVNIFFGKSVEAKAFAAAFNGIYNNCAFKTCVVSDLAYRFFDSAFNNFHAGFFRRRLL